MRAFTSDIGLADLHIHSRFSDGVSSIRQIMDHVEHRTPLDVIAITDHNTISGAIHAASLQDRYSFEVIIGEEVTTDKGEVIGLFLTDEIPKDLRIEEAVERIHEQGGLAIAPHPFSAPVSLLGGMGMGLSNVRELPLDGYEEHNGNPTTFYSNVLAKALIRPSSGLARLGASDSHAARTIGSAATAFNGKTHADLRISLETHETYPICFSSWIKQLLISAGSLPGIAFQARKYRNGTAEAVAATIAFAEEARRLTLPV